jgi:hypothetical protein
MTLPSDDMPIVVFDTNVIEGRYLAPLLRGEPCRDFELLRGAGYRPATYVKSFYEICNHVKHGNKRFPWMDSKLGFPGGIEEGERILRESPELSSKHNIYWMYGNCEEWRDLDWSEREYEMSELIVPQERDALHKDIDVRSRCAAWKCALSEFCGLIWESLNRCMYLITYYDLYNGNPANLRKASALEQELALTTLIPSEDFEILVAALMTNAVAFVTDDDRILAGTALSLSLNYAMAFVSPDQLRLAVDSRFMVRWSAAQTSRRGAADV